MRGLVMVAVFEPIFCDLQACAFVNKQFYTIAKPLLLWRFTEIYGLSAMWRGDLLDKIIKANPPVGHHIRHLYLVSHYSWTDDTLLLLMTRVPHLESLEVEYAFTEASLEHVPRHCPRLRWLDIGESRISRAFFLELGRHCLQLKTLTLGACIDTLPADAFLALGTTCRLEVLTLNLGKSNRRYGGAVNRRAEQQQQPPFDLTGLHHLTHLYINNGANGTMRRFFPVHSNNNPPVGHDRSLPGLTHLVLGDCYASVDRMLAPFLASHPDLQSFKAYHSPISDRTLKAIAKNIPNIREVCVHDCRNITHHGLRQLVCRCRLLTTVDCFNTGVYDYFGICADDIPEAGEKCMAWKHFEDKVTYLKCLDEEAIDRIRKNGTYDDQHNDDEDDDGDDDDDDDDDDYDYDYE
ncbi:unnamed protein product [Absidia cylindrospora]